MTEYVTHRRARRMRVGGSMGAGDPGQGGGHGGPSGAGGSRSGSTGGGGASSGSKDRTYRSLPTTTFDQNGKPSEYASAAEVTGWGAPVHYDYDHPMPNGQPTRIARNEQSNRALIDAVNDYRGVGDTGMDRLGKLLGSTIGVYEADPVGDLKRGPYQSQANWKGDALQMGATLAGLASGLPLGTLYNAGANVFGRPKELGQINLGPDVFGPDNPNNVRPAAGGYDQSYSNGPGASPTRTEGGGQPYLSPNLPVAPLSALAAASGSGATTGGSSGATPPAANDPYRDFNPYGQDYNTYGQRGEHEFFTPHMAEGGSVEAHGIGSDTTTAHVTPGEIMVPPELYQNSPGLLQAIMAAMHESKMDPEQYIVGGGGDDEYNSATGMPQYGFWKTVKKIGKKVLPVGIGLGTSALTGSDILGGLAGGASSKLLGNNWLTAGLTGLGTGALSYMSGLSDVDAAGMGGLNGLTGAAGHQAAISQASGGGDGWFDSALNFAKDNPVQLGGAALTLASALASKKQQSADSGSQDYTNPANDPALAEQIRNGGMQWDRQYNDPNADPEKINWYQYGQMPEWDYFKNEDKFSPVARKTGGAIPGKSALGALHDAGGMADGPGGGQDDKIPVYLSAKEYVVPADVVSDLGDGNPDEGARKLDKLRNNVRKQKGRKGFPPASKAKVEGYL